MPPPDGLELTREIRKASDTPIILLSARADEADKIVGLELGADDYVTKPFSPRELVSRVRALLRRSAAKSPEGGRPEDRRAELVVRGPLALDPLKRSVSMEGREIRLTTAQFDILALLASEPGRVFTRAAIQEGASGAAFEGYERTIDAQVKNIRKALGDDSESPRFIGTVRGVGYRFIEPPCA
jgi:DNA-binding response OmpR family regulator